MFFFRKRKRPYQKGRVSSTNKPNIGDNHYNIIIIQKKPDCIDAKERFTDKGGNATVSWSEIHLSKKCQDVSSNIIIIKPHD